MGGELTESRFDPITFSFDIMINYHLSQKLKLIGRNKFNHLTITLTVPSFNFLGLEILFLDLVIMG